jgi:hypothetical protein
MVSTRKGVIEAIKDLQLFCYQESIVSIIVDIQSV